ncbi:hypothetical protein DVH24_031742 [Malus domestica]|uniref:Uncharacterized protein n=1 Tax=Malus domestica TaxID=3750 RepID=A0A498J400_MALDO|nr:hypothetical protein DVH24_031742 [Malus domestica]
MKEFEYYGINNCWYGYVTPEDVPELLDHHIRKGWIIERLWRGQMRASSDEAEKINDQKLPNGESKKIEERPQENGNQIQNNENFSGYCQGANSNRFTCCKENDGSKEKKVKETRESCARKDALGKLSSLIRNWEQSDVLAATTVVGVVATVDVAYFLLSFFLWLFLFRDQRGLKKSNVDSFVDDVLVNDKPWASGVQEVLTSPHVYVCAHMSREEWNCDIARVLINKFKEEVFVTAGFHIRGYKYAGTLTIYSPSSNGSMTCHWYHSVFPDSVPKLLDWHIGRREIIERYWRDYRTTSKKDVMTSIK